MNKPDPAYAIILWVLVAFAFAVALRLVGLRPPVTTFLVAILGLCLGAFYASLENRRNQ